jgi:hypothetical protein
MMLPKKQSKPAHKGYEVGYGRPPKQSQFKHGQSGNPSGTNQKKSSIAEDLRPPLIRALYKRVGEFEDGDRLALRDVILLIEILGLDLTASEGKRTDVDVTHATETELRQALIDRGIPARMLPPVDEAGAEPPPDPPLPPDVEDESKQ